MFKYERFIIYPLFLLLLIYGFIGDSVIQARQEKEIFDRIETKELIIKNKKGIEVVHIGTGPEDSGGIAIYNQNGGAELVMTSSKTGGRIVTFNKNNGVGIAIISTEDGGEIQINHKEGIIGINILVDEDGSKIATIDKNNVIGTVMATVNSMGGGLVVYDEKGKNQRLYSSR
ncbi:MAG: hypothetical protein PHW83_06275 [Bacteroidales bacterium]|nr:hypothetical protein [Bacteroidales bacterium]